MKNQIIEKFSDLRVGDLVVIEERGGGILGVSTTRMHRIKKKTPATIVAGGRAWMIRKSMRGPSIGEHPAPGRHGVRRSICLPTPEQEAEFAKETAETIERCLGLLRAPETRALFAEDAEVILDRWKYDEAKLEQALHGIDHQTQMIQKAHENRAILVANVLTGARGGAAPVKS